MNRIQKFSKKTSRATSNHGVVLTWEVGGIGGNHEIPVDLSETHDSKVTRHLTSRFQPAPTLIKQRIEKLIERESLDRYGIEGADSNSSK